MTSWRKVGLYSVLTLFTIVNVYPFLWLVLGAFKSDAELLGDPGLLPKTWEFGAIRDTWVELEFVKYFRNSVIYTGASLIGIVAIYPMAGFAFAKLEFRGRAAIFGFFVSMMLVPGIISIIPLVVMIQTAGLTNTWPGVVLPTINGAAPLSMFLMRNYYRTLPHELYEAARLDGASQFTIYRLIYFPLSLPALGTILVLNVITIWNAYIVPSLIITDPDMFTLPLGVFSLRTSASPQWNVILAGSLIMVLPVLLTLVFFQRQLVKGSLAGAVRQ